MNMNNERKSEREAALDILLQVLEEGCFSGSAIDQELRRQPRTPESRAFINRLAEGTIERLITIDAVLDSCASVPCRKMKPVIRNILRESVYQMLFMDRVADAVAVNEAVALAKKRGFAGLAKFVNGVLRTVGRKKETFSFFMGKADICPERKHAEKTDDIREDGQMEEAAEKENEKTTGVRADKNVSDWAEKVSLYYSVPVWLARHMGSAVGRHRAETVFRAFLTVRPLQARINRSNAEKSRVIESLTAAGVHVTEHPYLGNVICLENATNLTRTEAFVEGWIQIQDASSVLAVAAAGIRPGMRVLDVCAAPGGKSLYAADLLSESRGSVVTDDCKTAGVVTGGAPVQASLVLSRDLTEAKVRKIRENAARCHFDGVIRTEAADARSFDPALEAWADVVIADLPCSGLGVIAKKPDIKYRVKPEDLTSLAALQREILSVVWRYVKPGGILIYSTCTVSPEENEQNVRWFLSQGYPMEADDMAPYLPERLASELKKRQKTDTDLVSRPAGVCDPMGSEKQQLTEKMQSAKQQQDAEKQQPAEPQGLEKLTKLQLLPGEYETDGFFIARFRRHPNQEHEEKN